MRLKIIGSVMAVVGIGGMLLASILFVSAFDSSRLLFAGLKVFGTIELVPVSIVMMKIGAAFCTDEVAEKEG